MAKVKKTYNLDERVAKEIEEYATAFGVSASAFVSLMVSQIGQVLKMAPRDEEKREPGESGED